jgi:multidrug resistance efflux pump/predicted esterase
VNTETTTTGGREEIDGAPLIDEQIAHRVLPESGDDYFVCRPADATSETPIFVAVHDIARDPKEQARAFAAASEAYGVVVIAPHFAADRYRNYQRLGRSRHASSRGRRADQALDLILADVASATGTPTQRIHLFGFGAGARFALRYAMAHPDRVAGAVIAAPGSYTFPDPQRRFPQGIAPGRGRGDLQFDPEHFLRVPIIIIEGQPDAASASPRRLERVGRSQESKNGRAWIEAMEAAALDARLDSRVSYLEIDEPLPSFKAFVDGGLPARALEALLGPAPLSSDLTDDDDLAAGEGQEGDGQAAGGFAKRWQQIRSIAVPLIALSALIGFLAPVGMWIHYRSTHVVARDAVVRGHIAEVGARLDGVVKSVEVDAGDSVSAGQIVARLEDRHFEAKLRQASSRLEKAGRELEVERLAIANERLRLAGLVVEGSAGLSAADAGVRANQSRSQDALRRYELQRSLAAEGMVAEEMVRAAETELRTARALVAASQAERNAASASHELALVESDGLAVREKRVSVLESEISGFRAELSVAEANLEGTIIRAPDDGAVVRRIVEAGGSAVVGQPIISLWVGERIWVEAWIDEDNLGDLEVGSEATVSFKSYPDREFTGVIESMGVSTDIELPDSEVLQPRSERMRDDPVISVRIRLDETDAELFPGLSAVVGIRKKAD